MEGKGNMDKLIISETDRGRYAVRPMNWAGIWNEKGQIKESLNHLALFIEKEDAEKFVEWKEAEEQNRLLKLPCAVGDTVYADSRVFGVLEYEVYNIVINKTITYQCSAYSKQIGDCSSECLDEIEPDISEFGKTVFLTIEDAEAALKELERGKGND